jgi:hypothetical protein
MISAASFFRGDLGIYILSFLAGGGWLEVPVASGCSSVYHSDQYEASSIVPSTGWYDMVVATLLAQLLTPESMSFH